MEVPSVHLAFSHLAGMRSGSVLIDLISQGFLTPDGCATSPFSFYGSEVLSQKSRVYTVDLSQVLERIQKAFRLQGPGPRALYEDKIWSLGDFTFQKRSYELIFARCLFESVTVLTLQKILKRTSDSRPLLLTSCRSAEITQALSDLSPIFALEDILKLKAGVFTSTPSALQTTLSKHVLKDGLTFTVSLDGHHVQKGTQTYRFQGFFQSQIIQELWLAHKQGTVRLRTQGLLEKIGSQSIKLNQVFKNHPTWREVIQVQGGFCSLKM